MALPTILPIPRIVRVLHPLTSRRRSNGPPHIRMLYRFWYSHNVHRTTALLTWPLVDRMLYRFWRNVHRTTTLFAGPLVNRMFYRFWGSHNVFHNSPQLFTNTDNLGRTLGIIGQGPSLGKRPRIPSRQWPEHQFRQGQPGLPPQQNGWGQPRIILSFEYPPPPGHLPRMSMGPITFGLTPSPAPNDSPTHGNDPLCIG